MDGDAANIPIIWVKAVFCELQTLQKNKKIASISVLGIQSSGKSTLLNTMFGLQFAVSAGRCTRGMFIQLVPVDKERSSFEFDYLMIIDTEGLKGPELGTDKIAHDNELATQVFGMGDAVIVNIKGETIADMENVLQIVVFSLIRIKQANSHINLKQSCDIVHQNVSAHDAAEQMQHGNQKTLQHLDKMTKEVAMQTHMSHIGAFTKVIEFDPSKHVRYIPDLWLGCPPMSPISTKYSETVQYVTESILLRMIEPSKKKYLNFKDTCSHLENLWNAILADDFAYSFRNCLEVKSFISLDTKYQSLVCDLKEFKLAWCNDNSIKSIQTCQHGNDIDVRVDDLYDSFLIELNKRRLSLEEELKTFVHETELRENMMHWEEKKLQSLRQMSEDLTFDVRRKMEEAKMSMKRELSTSNIKIMKENEIRQEALKLASNFKGVTASDEDLQQNFDVFWKTWIDKTSQKSPQPDLSSKIELSMNKAILEKFTFNAILARDLKTRECNSRSPVNHLDLEDQITNEHINVVTLRGTIKKMLIDSIENTRSVIKTLFDSITSHFDELSHNNTQYDKTQFSQILNSIKKTIAFQNDPASQNGFTFTDKLQSLIIIHVKRYSHTQFVKLNEAHNARRQQTIATKLEASYQQVWDLFKGIIDNKSGEIKASNALCSELEDLISDKVRSELSTLVLSNISQNYNRKFNLIKTILTDLARKEDFEQFMRYINTPQIYVREQLSSSIQKSMFDTCSGKSQYSKWASDIIFRITNSLAKATEEISKIQNTSTEDWLQKFRQKIYKEKLMTSQYSFRQVSNHEVVDFRSFSQCISERLKAVAYDLELRFECHRLNNLKCVDGKHVLDILLEKVWGCTHVCPWCKEPCAKAANHFKEHTDLHWCIQHRPGGVSGVRWGSSNKVAIESCNLSVCGSSLKMFCGNWSICSPKCRNVWHPCREYKTFMPDWDIAPSQEMSDSRYWSWFLVKFEKQLIEYYNYEPGEIPYTWKSIDRISAINNLSESEPSLLKCNLM